MYKTFNNKAITCSICGKRFLNMNALCETDLTQKSAKKKLCYECIKWTELIKRPPKGLEIIEGVAYNFLHNVKNKGLGVILGGNGQTKAIAKYDGTGKCSNDVWLIGTVPERFKDKLPDTGMWTSKVNGNRLSKTGFKCESKTCYDRYYCFRYDYHQEFENGPFNIPPITHVAGSEKCMSFIDIRKIQGYQYFDTNDMNYEEKS